MRERLIELIKSYRTPQTSLEVEWEQLKGLACSGLADHLLANGVIVPPCKVGDTVYYIYWNNAQEVGEGAVKEIYFNGCSFSYLVDNEGLYLYLRQREVYLTREEAEQALKGGAVE